jgi:hypothetical protein
MKRLGAAATAIAFALCQACWARLRAREKRNRPIQVRRNLLQG